MCVGEDVFFGKRVIEVGLALAHQGPACVAHSHDRSARDAGRRTFCEHVTWQCWGQSYGAMAGREPGGLVASSRGAG